MPRYYLLGFEILLVALADLVTKYFAKMILTKPVELLPFLHLELTQNSGIALGLPVPPLVTIPLSLLSIAILGWLYWYKTKPDSKLATLAFGLLFGGSLGNLFERITSGSVTDFLALSIIPNFNLADLTITLGSILLVIFYRRIFTTLF